MIKSKRALQHKLLASWALSRASWATIRTGTRLAKAFTAKSFDHESSIIRDDVQGWGRELCRAFDIRVSLRGAPLDTGPGILVGNHMSYLDIPTLLSIEPMRFVAKAEVKSFPVIGPAAAGFGVIFIERSSDASRKTTSQTLTRAVKEQGRRVVVFPEGTTSLKGLPWRAGVFKLAEEHGLPMQAMSICYKPAREVAFESPSMLEHAMNLARVGPIEAIVTLGPSFVVTDFLKDFATWEAWSKETLAAELSAQGLG